MSDTSRPSSQSARRRARAAEPLPEVELLLCCARVELDGRSSRRIRELIAGGLDWDRLFDLSLRHGLMPLLHLHLNAKAVPAAVPPEAASRLRDFAQRVSALNAYLTSELRSLLRIFAERSIPAIPYKGPALALQAYGQVALRQFCDLDIIVRVEDVPAVREILQSRGYAPYQELGAAQQAVMLRTQCNLPFTRDGDRTIVEVHWRVSAPDFGRPLEAEELWGRSREADFGGVRARALAAEDLLLALCVHGSKHCWERLGWICDIARLVERTPALNWDELRERARRKGGRRMLLLGLALAGELLDTELPPEVQKEIDSDGAVRRLARSVRAPIFRGEQAASGMGGYFRFQLEARERFGDKLRYCRYALRPTDEDLASLSLPRALSFGYYLLRPLRLLWTGGPDSLRRRENSDPAR